MTLKGIVSRVGDYERLALARNGKKDIVYSEVIRKQWVNYHDGEIKRAYPGIVDGLPTLIIEME